MSVSRHVVSMETKCKTDFSLPRWNLKMVAMNGRVSAGITVSSFADKKGHQYTIIIMLILATSLS
jgi:hypothetical protein